MRKTYKPLARAEKASQMFRKKTLNVNDNLNIKHDDDDIENVDEYWSTAVSVIGNSTIDSIDNEKSIEPSDTLFNINTIRKSIQGEGNIQKIRTSEELAEDLYRQSVDEGKILQKGLAESSTENSGIESSNRESHTGYMKATIKKVVTSEEDSSLIRLPDGKDNSAEANNFDGTNSGYIISDGIDMDPGIQNDTASMIGQESEIKENSMNRLGIETALKPDVKGDVNMALKSFKTIKTSPKKKSSSTTRQKEVSQKVHSEVESTSSFERTRIEAHDPKKQKRSHIFEVENTVLNLNKNTIAPLFCSISVDVATMTLDYLAYVDNYKTENAFSVYIIKGKIELTVNGQTKIAPKGSVSVVERDDVCSVNCISKNGAILLLTYAL
ncbi:uncharacterized protein VICG_01175 [Vittaforma corneae ATCC 50505]|uniref:Uncharacterized protein n=1 Tax=Vittaforma corneae (strain ATCC 50505) TaxID=993615 RepID=L2GLQ7_VITCO|nr:uncharacterized protein VICG_01175 [Vittaforma corneae ATCC 50505]ELA41823.1 hypothetical protein VICG_01175 [Vittaforma corneae ATCC 50505]